MASAFTRFQDIVVKAYRDEVAGGFGVVVVSAESSKGNLTHSPHFNKTTASASALSSVLFLAFSRVLRIRGKHCCIDIFVPHPISTRVLQLWGPQASATCSASCWTCCTVSINEYSGARYYALHKMLEPPSPPPQ
jgi:hypothetical protein